MINLENYKYQLFNTKEVNNVLIKCYQKKLVNTKTILVCRTNNALFINVGVCIFKDKPTFEISLVAELANGDWVSTGQYAISKLTKQKLMKLETLLLKQWKLAYQFSLE